MFSVVKRGNLCVVGDEDYVGCSQHAFLFIGIEYRPNRLVRDRPKISNLAGKSIAPSSAAMCGAFPEWIASFN
jgi:hypothetical protein